MRRRLHRSSKGPRASAPRRPGPGANAPAAVNPGVARPTVVPEQNPDAVLRVADDGRVLYVNPSARAMFERELARGGLAPPELLPAVRQALASGALQETELRHGDRWLSVRTTPDGNVYARDITDRKQAEEALRNSERHANRLNAVLSGISRIFREALTCATEEELGKVCLSVAEEITQSKFGYIDELNPATGKLDAIALSDPGWDACRMHDPAGHGQKALTGFSIVGLHGRVLREGAALLSNAPSSHPSSAGTPEGHPPLTAFLGVPLKHAGRTIGLIGLGNREGGYGEDELAAVEALAPAIVQAFVSKRAEARLRRGHEEYSLLVEGSGSVILRVDKEMRITFVNQYGLRFFGYRPEELIGERALGTIIPLRETTGRDTATMAEDILRHPERYRQNVHQNLRKDGSLVWMSWTNTPVYDDAGEFIEVLSIGNDLSAFKQAEEAASQAAASLQESEARYRNLVELAPDAVLVHADRKIVFANPEALRLYGAGALEELLGRDIVELVAPEDRETSAERAEHAERGHATPAREFRLLTLDGRCVPAEARGSGVHFQGRPAVQVIIRDITDRKRAEEALRDSEARFHSVFESAPVGIVIGDLEGHVLESNVAFAQLLGCTPEELRGKPFQEFTHPDDLAAELSLVEEMLAGRRDHYQIDKRFLRKDGAVVDVRLTGGFLGGPHAGRSVAIAEDVTARKRAEEAVALAHRQTQSLIDNTPDLVYAFDLEERFVLANAAIAGLLGSTPALMIGKSRRQFMPDEDAAWHEANDRQVLEHGKAMEFEERSQLRGRSITWLTKKFPLRDANGRVFAVAGISADISARKQAEEALRRLSDQLRESDRRKDEFLATLSHELRNPLAPISNSLYVLDRAAPGGAQAKRAKDVIDRQVAHLSRLVNDLLDVTRITRNKIPLQRERADLRDVVRRSVEDQRSLFDGRQLVLEADLPEEAILVDADTTRMAQVVDNLLQNAAKFTRRGGRTRVSVSTDPPRAQAVVRVSDTGAGMTAETIAGLFRPFVQADHTLDRSGGGLGLGLALVKGLVELHGGEVSAHSDGLGHGAEFVVRLPLAGGAGPRAELAGAPPPAPARILLIEDHVDAAESLREVLELSGHEVFVAHDGPEGIAKARACRPAFVLCDVGLPGMDGYAVARAFRRDDDLKRIHLVALSGYALPEDLQRATEAGFERHLAKPPDLAALAAILGAASRGAGDDVTAAAVRPERPR